jgi:hypothetical protein
VPAPRRGSTSRSDRALRAVERREETVSRCVHLTAAKPRELGPDDGVVRIKQGMPVTVTDLRCSARRVHDVGEQHRRKHPIIGHLGLLAGKELGDLLEGFAPRLHEVIHVAARQLDVLRPRYAIGEVLAPRGQDDRVVGVLEDEWRRRDDFLAFFDHHASNGPTEAINGRLEALRRNALGFRNLTHYRIRSLLHSGALHALVNAL